MAVQAIPTRYNGLLYRSRCEARWAVVFDKLGWAHHYEPEAYRLGTGAYLPDFYLPDLGLYFEVKASYPRQHELVKAEELAVASEKPVIVSTGPPDHTRSEIMNDLIVFYPELLEDEIVAFQYEGGFVSGRFFNHPTCSLHLGNLSYCGARADVSWRDAFIAASDERFGIYPAVS